MLPVRIRQAFALVFLVALCGAATANSASAKSSVVCQVNQVSSISKPCTKTPACAANQTSTKAKPCVTAAQINNAPPEQEVAPVQIDPGDTGERQGLGDAVTVITFLDIPRGLYQLSVENTSGLGYINTFTWVAPENMNITQITSSEGGKCTLVAGNISCRGGGKGIAPPKCTCQAGGTLTVNFTATGLSPTYNGHYYTWYGIEGGWLHLTSMTPVPYHIPSFIAPQVDLPLCGSTEHKSKVSTTASPCATS
jgi:hypothetical protein